MKINDLIKGFRITNISEVEEIKATAYEMIHEKTLAKLIWLKREDDNKTFAITFKTLPSDSTGVFHILEHSVLNGSEKFPLKEPFVDLLKGSLQTFLNAMTYPDKTVYPVASRNEQDFINLMRVYLDGVFNPMVKKNPNIFYQEGWHYELKDIETPIEYKGVVYNEMKGAFSSPERMCPELLQTQLFPDNCYGYVSGGDPKHIPDLTYQQFCAAHDKFYNPTNSFIWLDGDMDIEKMLGIIDEEYLSKYQVNEDKVEFSLQNPINQPLFVQDYEIEKDSETNNKTFISKGYVIGEYSDIEKALALNIVGSILTANNQSPLKKALIENNLAQDIDMGVSDGVLQPYVEIDVYNTNPEKYDEIATTIKSVLQNVVENGLNKDEISAYLNMLEFSTKERDFGSAPKGLVFGLQALNSWLYGGNPLKSILFNDVFKFLREKIQTSYYEDLIREFILNSKHSATVLLKPNAELEEMNIQKMKEKLDDYKNSLTKKELEDLVQFNQQLSLWQAQEDTDEVKAMLPKLTIEDVNEKPSKIDYDVTKTNDIATLLYKNSTEGINYQNLFFNVDDKSKEELQKIALIVKLLPELPTENYDVLTFSRLRKTYIGSTTASMHISTKANRKDYNAFVGMSYSCLEVNDQKALELIKELLYNVKFEDTKTILDVLMQEKSSMEMMFSGRGNAVGISRVSATLSEASAVNEYISGLEYYYFLKETIKNFSEDTVKELKEIYQSLFTTNRLTLSLMGPSKDEVGEKIISVLKESKEEIVPIPKPLLKIQKEGIAVASAVGYAEMGFLAPDNLTEFEGNLLVANKILSLDYLWTNVRAMGGAYGCGAVSKYGCFLFYSYRDPNPANSLNVYKNTPEYLRALCEKDFDLSQYIIGTIGDGDPLLTNSTIMLIGNAEYFSGITYEDRCEKRKKILSTTKEDILKIADIYQKSMEEHSICVVGGKHLLEKLELDTIHEL